MTRTQASAGVAAANAGDATAAGCRPLRADAARNRQRILEAAEEVFARDGIAVPVDVVAARAGVGVGTLYRHFPTKEALFEAVVQLRLDELLAAASVEPGGDATEAFFSFLEKMCEQVALKHDLFDALAEAGVDLKTRCATQVDALKESVRAMHRRAIDGGGVRGDVTTDEVMGLVLGACSQGNAPSPDGSANSTERMVRVVCDGLRAGR